jgi:hypothetical protein
MPYASMKDVPEVFKAVAPARGKRPVALSLAQVNELAKIFDSLKDDPKVENPVGLAKAVFRKNHQVKSGKWVKIVKKEEGEQEVKEDSTVVEKTIGIQTVLKSDERKRYIMGPVLVPGVPDTQGDVMSREEVEKAFFGFFGSGTVRIERQHGDRPVDARVIERFLSNETVIVKDGNGKEYPAGTFCIGMILPVAKDEEEDIYEEILNDPELFGFSVRGFGKRRPIESPGEVK